MITACPSIEALTAVLIINGREPGMCKHVLDSGWWFIDESAPLRKRIPGSDPQPMVEPAVCLPTSGSPLHRKLIATAQSDGWRVVDHPNGMRVDLGGRRRAKAGLAFVEGRGPSLYVEVPIDSGRIPDGAAAFVLRLTAFMRRVRASLLDFGNGQQLVWEVPLEPADDSDEQLIEALCCLADAVQHGHAEAEMLARDEATAARWLEMNFPSEPQTQKTTNNTRPWSSTTTPSPSLPATSRDNAERLIRLPGVRL